MKVDFVALTKIEQKIQKVLGPQEVTRGSHVTSRGHMPGARLVLSFLKTTQKFCFLLKTKHQLGACGWISTLPPLL